MNVLIINGSPGKRGNTDYLLREILFVIEKRVLNVNMFKLEERR